MFDVIISLFITTLFNNIFTVRRKEETADVTLKLATGSSDIRVIFTALLILLLLECITTRCTVHRLRNDL